MTYRRKILCKSEQAKQYPLTDFLCSQYSCARNIHRKKHSSRTDKKTNNSKRQKQHMNELITEPIHEQFDFPFFLNWLCILTILRYEYKQCSLFLQIVCCFHHLDLNGPQKTMYKRFSSSLFLGAGRSFKSWGPLAGLRSLSDTYQGHVHPFFSLFCILNRRWSICSTALQESVNLPNYHISFTAFLTTQSSKELCV